MTSTTNYSLVKFYVKTATHFLLVSVRFGFFVTGIGDTDVSTYLANTCRGKISVKKTKVRRINQRPITPVPIKNCFTATFSFLLPRPLLPVKTQSLQKM